MSRTTKTVTEARPLVGSAERSEDSRSESERSAADPTKGRRDSAGAGSNETLERPTRRRFSEEYKHRVLDEADAVAGVPGGVGALLRREGLYSSHLATWRQARLTGVLASKRRGPKPQPARAEGKRIQQLENEIERLQHRLKKAETIIEFQKKLHELLSSPETDARIGDSGSKP